MKTDRCPSSDEWIITVFYIYTMESSSVKKKDENKKFISVELETITQSEAT